MALGEAKPLHHSETGMAQERGWGPQVVETARAKAPSMQGSAYSEWEVSLIYIKKAWRREVSY